MPFDVRRESAYIFGVHVLTRTVAAAALIVASTHAGGSVAAAQGYSVAPTSAARRVHRKLRVAAVIEGAGDSAFAAKVRKLMEQHLSLPVVDLSDLDSGDEQPDIVVSIAASRPKDIRVLYWDRTGLTDMLSAPATNRSSVGLVAASLAVAVVRKHAETLASAPEAVVAHRDRTGPWVTPSQLRRFFTQLVPVRHRTEGLSEADF